MAIGKLDLLLRSPGRAGQRYRHDSPRPHCAWLWGSGTWQLATALLVFLAPSATFADVVVIANRAGRTLAISVISQQGSKAATLAPGACLPFVTSGRVRLQLTRVGRAPLPEPTGEPREYTLRPNTANFFVQLDDYLDLRQIDLGGDDTTLRPRESSSVREPVVVPVSIWVDDEQPFREKYWRERLTRRLERAAEILLRHSGVQFRVTRFGTWDSDDQTTVFRNSLMEFIEEVDADGTLAIGFTSQYPQYEPRTRLGGTRFPLDRHILIREWGNISEPERVEVVAHELGHHLGAGHSIEPDSVMRPVLGDGLARSRRFRVQFDPVNTLVMSLVGEEVRGGDVARLHDLSSTTRLRLRQIYTELAVASPNDPIPPKYMLLLQ